MLYNFVLDITLLSITFFHVTLEMENLFILN